MSATVAMSTTTYDVDFAGKNYSVVFATDHNVGYTDITVFHEGNEVDVAESNNVVDHVQEELSKGRIHG